MTDWMELMLRLAVAAVAGTVVGLEREARGQLAGMRTHALVSIGACLYTVLGAYGFPGLIRGPNADPMRVAAQVVSGIGFIGAGAILRDRAGIRGVTTAAALWVSASLGMAAGAGLFAATWLGMSAVLLALIGLRLVREGVQRHLLRHDQRISVIYRRGNGTLGPLIAAVEDVGGQLRTLQIEDEDEDRHVRLTVRVRGKERLHRRLDTIACRPEVGAITYT